MVTWAFKGGYNCNIMVVNKYSSPTLLCNGSFDQLDWTENKQGLVKHSFGVPMSGFWPLTKELFKREPVKKHTLRTFKFVMVSNSWPCHKSKSDEAEWGFQWWNINRDKCMTTEKIIIKFKPCVSLCTTTSIINNLIWSFFFFGWFSLFGLKP